MGAHSINHDPIKTYTMTGRNRMISFILIGIGLASIGYAFATDVLRAWANLLLGNFYFMAVALASLFFVAVQYVAEVGWSAQIKRIPMAISTYLVPAVLFMIIIFAAGHHHLYHWTHHGLYEKGGPEYDEIVAGKAGYLNITFYFIRLVAYAVIWAGAALLLRRESLREDLNGGTKHYFKSVKLSAIFLVLFAVSSSTSAWDLIMSIDVHWFSTLFGWYTFAGLFVTGMTVLTLTVIYLKKNGYLPNVNENHIHDLGKFMFAFSVFWTYLWFSQFMLYWYANLPEEVTYYLARQTGYYKPLFILNFVMNFLFPFLVLMSRDSKRHEAYVIVAGIFIMCGHWLDMYLMIMPGTVGLHGGFGIPEIGSMCFFGGLFLYTVFTMLSKAPVVPKNHPMLDESYHHHI